MQSIIHNTYCKKRQADASVCILRPSRHGGMQRTSIGELNVHVKHVRLHHTPLHNAARLHPLVPPALATATSWLLSLEGHGEQHAAACKHAQDVRARRQCDAMLAQQHMGPCDS